MSRTWRLVVPLSGVVAALAVVTRAPAVIRGPSVLWFLLVVPGMAIVGHLGVARRATRWTLALVVSAAVDILVAEYFLYARTWRPTLILVVLGVFATVVVITAPVPPAPQPAPVTSPGTRGVTASERAARPSRVADVVVSLASRHEVATEPARPIAASATAHGRNGVHHPSHLTPSAHAPHSERASNGHVIDAPALRRDPMDEALAGRAGFDVLEALLVSSAHGGARAPVLRVDDRRAMALLAAMAAVGHGVDGFTNRSLCIEMAERYDSGYRARQATYDLRRLRLNGLIEAMPGGHVYRVTERGRAVAEARRRLAAPPTVETKVCS